MFDPDLYDCLKMESLAYWDEVSRRASLYGCGRCRKQTDFDEFAVNAFYGYGDCRWKAYLDMMCYWDHHVDSGSGDVTARAATVDAILRGAAGEDRYCRNGASLPVPEYGLERFVAAQRSIHGLAADELRNGRKTGHWMWFEFPQMRGLGRSELSWNFGLSGLDEAAAYLRHPLLASRLYELCAVLMNRTGVPMRTVLGPPDDMKLRSSMALFDQVEPNGIFADVLDAFYSGLRCEPTLKLLGLHAV